MLFVQMRRVLIPLTVCILLSSCVVVNGQTVQGDIQGTIRDAQGRVVPGAKIAIANEATGSLRTVESDPQGDYHAVGFFTGTYRIEVEKAGFQKTAVPGVEVGPLVVKRVDVTLAVSTISAIATVTESAPVLQGEGSTLSTGVRNVLIDKPINNVSRLGVVMSFAAYSPGASAAPRGYWMFYGLPASQTEQTLEGAQQPGSFGDINQYDNPTAVREISIIAGVPPAEYVRPVIANITHKSGSNQLHGAYTVDLKNPATDAVSSPSGNPPPPPGFSQWRYEYNLGGPVYLPKVYDGRNKTFFFFDLWKPRGGSTIGTYPHTIPTARMRAGDYSHFPVKPVDPLTGNAFPGDVIPANRISPVAQAIMNTYFTQYQYIGNPDSTNLNATYPSHYGYLQNQVALKVDQNLGSGNVFSFDYKHLNQITLQNNGGGNPPPLFPEGTKVLRNSDGYNLGYTRIVTPKIVNQLRLSVWRYIEKSDPTTNDRANPVLIRGVDVLARWGIQGITPTTATGYPTIAITNWGQESYSTSSATFDSRYQFSENVSYLRGKHTFKAGATGLKALLDNPFVAGFGSFTFDGRMAKEPFADFLLGLPGSFSRTQPRTWIARRISEYGLFAQDEWRVTSRLSLSYGVRWAHVTAPYDKNNQYYNFDLATGQIVVPNQRALNSINSAWPSGRIPIVLAAKLGYPEKLTNPASRFEPRLGFAYRPTGSANLVVRGGYGVFEGRERFGALQTGGPFAVTEAYSNSLVSGAPQYSWPNAFPAVGTSTTASTGATVSQDYRPEYTQVWNLTAEKEVLTGWGLRLSYMGNKTTQLLYNYDANTPLISTLPFSQSRRPYPAFQSITATVNGGNAHYNSLQVLLNHPFRNGLDLQVSYIEQRGISDQGGAQLGFTRQSSPAVTLDYAYDRNRDSAVDGTWPYHQFVTNFAYELPFGRGKRWLSNTKGSLGKMLLAGVAGNWSTTGVFLARSGQFFTPAYTGKDPGNVNQFNGRPDQVPGCDPYTHSKLGTTIPYLNQSCFAIPANGTLGNAAINSLESPGAWVLSVSPWKEFHIPRWDTAVVRVGASIYNVLNHPSYGAGGSMGVITTPAGKFPVTSPVVWDSENGGQRSFAFEAKFIF